MPGLSSYTANSVNIQDSCSVDQGSCDLHTKGVIRGNECRPRRKFSRLDV